MPSRSRPLSLTASASMNQRSQSERTGRVVALSVVCGSLFLGMTAADAGKAGPDARRGLGQCLSAPGTLIVCEGPGKACRAVKQRGLVCAEDLLHVLPGFRAEVETARGAL